MRLIFIITLLPTVIFGQKNVSPNLAKYMQAQVELNNFGGAVLVTRNDTVILKQAYGLADYEWDIKNTVDTKFSLASVSKQFTAAAILQLMDKKQLSLDEKLNKFFQGFPNGDSITIHMLLTHMSGLQMDFDELYLNNVSITRDSALKYIEQKALLFSPGTNTAYSNIGYYLLARIIEKISNQSYSEYLKTNIFEKAKMNNTGVITNNAIIPKIAKNYIPVENKYENNPYINWAYNIGHDGVYSTVEDLSLWDNALYGTTILTTEMKKLMFTSYNDQNFGYGFLVNPFYNQGHQLIAHDGGFFGAMTSVNRFTNDKLCVTVLSNNQSPSYIIAYGLSGICFGRTVELPYKHYQIKGDTTLYGQFAGKYGKIEIIKVENKLFYNNIDIELLPESKTKFFRADNNNRTIEFIMDKKNIVNGIIMTKGGVEEIVKKDNLRKGRNR